MTNLTLDAIEWLDREQANKRYYWLIKAGKSCGFGILAMLLLMIAAGFLQMPLVKDIALILMMFFFCATIALFGTSENTYGDLDNEELQKLDTYIKELPLLAQWIEGYLDAGGKIAKPQYRDICRWAQCQVQTDTARRIQQER